MDELIEAFDKLAVWVESQVAKARELLAIQAEFARREEEADLAALVWLLGSITKAKFDAFEKRVREDPCGLFCTAFTEMLTTLFMEVPEWNIPHIYYKVHVELDKQTDEQVKINMLHEFHLKLMEFHRSFPDTTRYIVAHDPELFGQFGRDGEVWELLATLYRTLMALKEVQRIIIQNSSQEVSNLDKFIEDICAFVLPYLDGFMEKLEQKLKSEFGETKAKKMMNIISNKFSELGENSPLVKMRKFCENRPIKKKDE